MIWYYADESRNKIGPLNDSDLNALSDSGKITPNTLVWRKGMTKWEPYGAVRKKMIVVPSSAETVKEIKDVKEAICHECKDLFPQNDMVQYEDKWICPECKPAFFQKIKEGVYLSDTLKYGGFWIRYLAKVIDWMAIGVVMFIPSFLVGFFGAMSTQQNPSADNSFGLLNLLLVFLQYSIGIAYHTWFVGKYGATPGKMALNLKVIRADGGEMTYKRAFGRFFAEILSGILLYIGYIIAAFNEEKKSLHDMMCNTRVVRI